MTTTKKNKLGFIPVYTVVSKLENKNYILNNVPSWWAFKTEIIKDFTGRVIKPCFNPGYGDSGSTAANIVTLVDMFYNKIGFSFDSHQDLVDVFRSLENYLTWIDETYGKNTVPPDHEVFYTRAVEYFRYLYGQMEILKRIYKKSDSLDPSFSSLLFGDKCRF